MTNQTKYGVHGYDNEATSMRAVFMAKGPLFSKGKILRSVNMIDLYNLFCSILSIKGCKSDGANKLDTYNSKVFARNVHDTGSV